MSTSPVLSPSADRDVSICLIAGYFGRLPPYFDCVLRSCEFNPSIQWVILTDDETPWDLPVNVRLLRTTLSDLQAQFSRKVGFEVCLNRSYLLCDFRPAFGILFEELLAGFAFWGHCDLDVVFGDLRHFLRPDILERHDRILQRGHLSIYRNTDQMNRAFMRLVPGAMDYRDVFVDQASRGFDEWRGIYRILRFLGIPQYREEVIADIIGPTDYKYPRFECTELPNHSLQVFYWYRGKVFQAYLNQECGIEDREVAYIHFQKRPLPKPGFDVRRAEGFLITPDGFLPYAREHLTAEDFLRFNRGRLRPLEEIRRILFGRIRQKLRRWIGRVA
jgi:hypothetical protein